MKTIKLFSITLFCTLLSFSAIVQAAQTGNSRQTRKVAAFHGISVSSGIDLFLTQKDQQEVRVEVDDEDMENLVTKVEDGILKIYMKNKSWFNMDWNSNSRKVYVSFKTLDWLQASAGSEVVSQSVLNLENLKVDASSGSDIELELNTSELSAESSSGSDIHLIGKGQSLRASASSGSEIDATDFHAKRCHADVSSGSNIRVHVTEELDAHASSGGNIGYAGNPAHKDINESSGGDVHPR